MSWNVVNVRPFQSGGYGDLFIGQRTDTGDQVVIKRLRDAHVTEAKKAFAREVRILGRRLPGLVQLLAWDLNANPPYYIMPYLGGSLKAYTGRLTVEQLLGVVGELAASIGRLHEHSIFHGDVKPDNILVSRDGHLQIADPLGNGLGCTMFFSENRGGTPGYWAPEVRDRAPIHAAGDVYSLGATLYELTTGQRPVDGQTLDPGPWSHFQVREIIQACCNPQPPLRPTMKEVGRMVQGERWEAIQSQKQKQRELVGACVIGGVLLAAFLVLTQGSTKA